MAGKKPSRDRRSKPGVWQERLSEYKQEILKLAILGVPLAILESVTGRVSDRLLDQPWHAIALLIPIAAVGTLLARQAARGGSPTLDRRTLALLGAYLLFFAVAAEAHVLDWKRDPSLFGQPSKRSWLTPVAWGDWRYRLVRKVDEEDKVVIVLREPTAGKTRESARAELVSPLGLAAAQGAKGVGFDYYFDRESAIDSLVCATVDTLGIPVVFGYGFTYEQQHMIPRPVPLSLRSCAKPEREGHLVGFLDADHKARMMPLFFNNDRGRPALSLVISRIISGDVPVSTPDDGRLQFVEPIKPHLRVRLADLLDASRSDESTRDLLHRRFVLVGEASEPDSFDTPFGRQPGAVVHAIAIHSLVHSHYIRYAPAWVRFLSMLIFCYSLAVWCTHGWPVRRLLFVCLLATACFWATAVVGVLAGPFWFDAVYPTIAAWLLLPLLLMLRRVTSARLSRASTV
jgi:CHASE2 domain